MHISNTHEVTWVDTSGTLHPTQEFPDLSEVKSEKKKENWAKEQQTTHLAKTCPFFLLQSLYLYEGFYLLPA